ncbi:MAG: hypothetical protein ACD_78C00161G0002 [uncultured bacterium (gcode 4)]|uniref:Uncharacterized protein n=1 Tax=uncultured bacterium (gcode 4) TaxID=1234023 RepID=K1XY60_9BACT|nr:MAG: hypothetical protein ACD_78C00161G0002 [uncultured bacterium (gcode 4)]
MNKENLTPEDIRNIRENLMNYTRVENIVRCVSIAFEALGIPREEQLNDVIQELVYTEWNRVLTSARSEEIVPQKIQKISSDSFAKPRTKETVERMQKNIENAELVRSVFHSVASSLSTLGIPVNDALYVSIHRLVKQEIGKVFDSVETIAVNPNESGEITAENLEPENFHIDSTGWKEIRLPQGIRIKINPEEDVTEILEGEFRGEQYFSHNAAIRETKKAGKKIPDNEEWRNIIRSINASLDFCEKPQNDTSVRETLGLKLSGYQYGPRWSYKERSVQWYYWSSSFISDFGHYIAVSEEKIEPIRSTGGVYMFSIRCLKDKK